MCPDSDKTVSHETIYNAIYLHPRAELKRELIAACAMTTRCASRAVGALTAEARSGHAEHPHPPEIEDRLIPGHWEGDLIKGEGNRSSVGTLVERTTLFVVLAMMDNAGTRMVVESFSAVLNRQPAGMRKSMTYDQGREMHGNKILTERTGVQIYFAYPHSPWQRGSNENTNGLLRQYMPKGSDLSIYSQDDLDAIALSLNTGPRETLGRKTPLAVYTEHMARLQLQADLIH
jgi:IS30 family transposase